MPKRKTQVQTEQQIAFPQDQFLALPPDGRAWFMVFLEVMVESQGDPTAMDRLVRWSQLQKERGSSFLTMIKGLKSGAWRDDVRYPRPANVLHLQKKGGA